MSVEDEQQATAWASVSLSQSLLYNITIIFISNSSGNRRDFHKISITKHCLRSIGSVFCKQLYPKN